MSLGPTTFHFYQCTRAIYMFHFRSQWMRGFAVVLKLDYVSFFLARSVKVDWNPSVVSRTLRTLRVPSKNRAARRCSSAYRSSVSEFALLMSLSVSSAHDTFRVALEFLALLHGIFPTFPSIFVCFFAEDFVFFSLSKWCCNAKDGTERLFLPSLLELSVKHSACGTDKIVAFSSLAFPTLNSEDICFREEKSRVENSSSFHSHSLFRLSRHKW